MSKKSPDPNDVVVGQRIRAARQLVGISQPQLAKDLQLTFQQVQKYEKGVNRVSIGRLVQISQITKQPLSYFTSGMDNGSKEAVNMSFIETALSTRHGVRIMRAFSKLDLKNQVLLADLAESMTRDHH